MRYRETFSCEEKQNQLIESNDNFLPYGGYIATQQSHTPTLSHMDQGYSPDVVGHSSGFDMDRPELGIDESEDDIDDWEDENGYCGDEIDDMEDEEFDDFEDEDYDHEKEVFDNMNNYPSIYARKSNRRLFISFTGKKKSKVKLKPHRSIVTKDDIRQRFQQFGHILVSRTFLEYSFSIMVTSFVVVLNIFI